MSPFVPKIVSNFRRQIGSSTQDNLFKLRILRFRIARIRPRNVPKLGLELGLNRTNSSTSISWSVQLHVVILKTALIRQHFAPNVVLILWKPNGRPKKYGSLNFHIVKLPAAYPHD